MVGKGADKTGSILMLFSDLLSLKSAAYTQCDEHKLASDSTRNDYGLVANTLLIFARIWIMISEIVSGCLREVRSKRPFYCARLSVTARDEVAVHGNGLRHKHKQV